MGEVLRVEFPVCMRRFFAATADDGLPVRYRSARGGRGGVKSWSISRALILKAMRDSLFIVCGREFQKSIRDSVHRLLGNQLDLLGVRAEFDVRDTYIRNRVTGSEFVFYGLHHNVESLKSLEGADVLWVEEAETVSEDSWTVVDPTIRKPGSEIWLSWNPRLEDDPTYKRFVSHKLPGTIDVEVSWQDNPWLPEVLQRQAVWMREHDPERYEYVWGGKTFKINKAAVLAGKWHVREFEPPRVLNEMRRDEDGAVLPMWTGPYGGADFGFAQDPSCLTKSFVEVLNPEDIDKTIEVDGVEAPASLRRNLYIREEAFANGCETASTPTQLGLADMYDTVSGSRHFKIKGDSARPETISHLRNVDGFNIEPCEKWQGSVADGITFLRGFENIYIHPSCVRLIEEARLWSYKLDPLTKKVLPVLKKGFDHGWDSVRYALGDMIQRSPQPAGEIDVSFPT